MPASLRLVAPATLLLSVALLSPVWAQAPAVSFAPNFTGFEDTASNTVSGSNSATQGNDNGWAAGYYHSS